MQQLDLNKFHHQAPVAGGLIDRRALAAIKDQTVSKFNLESDSDRTIDEMVGKVLVVDDDPAVLYYACAMLKKMGFQVVKARSSRIALNTFRSAGPFDLALADVTLAKISGPRLLKLLKNQQPELPTLLISGLPYPADGGRETPSEATPFLAKPFTFEDLQGKVQDILNSSSDDGTDR